ncbi:MAG TPA: hypothetical protein VGJ07_27345 [Rugosimonospora sp.]
MRVAILRPLAVTDDSGRPVDLNGPRLRTLVIRLARRRAAGGQRRPDRRGLGRLPAGGDQCPPGPGVQAAPGFAGAARALGSAEAIRGRPDLGSPDVAGVVEAARAGLGPERYVAEYAAGLAEPVGISPDAVPARDPAGNPEAGEPAAGAPSDPAAQPPAGAPAQPAGTPVPSAG